MKRQSDFGRLVEQSEADALKAIKRLNNKALRG